ncbi:hypothetical protein [Halomonas huangheensis]|uniref:Prephenate dehydratase n=1 Tax=Halomonas huangheensis TaxID=1178482 RepID=W1N7Q0_9GAMM|nr:hypothetical protein [Halomonas huangheensis]ALM51035.1 hypothetical protein AR456_01035 [Halomonas huangheensis]ERL51216.1 hypothetical protein BJB45_15045 [Halomonas huangheensis]
MHFATLGPADSNHALVLSRYLEARDLTDSHVSLIDDFPSAFSALVAGHYDYLLQVSAHFSHADCVGQFMHRAWPVDTFIAPSRPLALVARCDVTSPRSVLRQPATRFYTDLSDWQEIDAATIVEALTRLRAGEADAAIVAADALSTHADELTCLQQLGPALDVWVLYASRPLTDGSSPRQPSNPLILNYSTTLTRHFAISRGQDK